MTSETKHEVCPYCAVDQGTIKELAEALRELLREFKAYEMQPHQQRVASKAEAALKKVGG